jgi:hypothetical protein
MIVIMESLWAWDFSTPISMCSKSDKFKNNENLNTICVIDVITAVTIKITVSKDVT